MYYTLLALIAGFTITAQAGLNNKLLSYIGSPILTAFISFLVGTVGLAAVYAISAAQGLQALPTAAILSQTSFWMWLGGLLGAFYIASTVLCAPKLGFAAMFSLVIAGQIITTVIFDHFAILGTPLHLLTPTRAIGIVMLIVSVYLIQTN